MCSGPVFCGISGNRTHRILYLAGFKVALATLVTLIAPSFLPAVWASSLNVPVRQRLFGLRIPCNLDFVLEYVPLLFEFEDNL
ncbi:hypothetical protein C487_18586 [Natrinema pallidum DSM 3751]|uniref:Uncharacterized protein n=1 Tax=Natrinema pallidum DSM 3751 TaxID=1227495 RepID=L9YEZ8_9EURY|nr:hypothetical protein C487_18586 [Natrinema pallidum DSM 3751]